MAAERVADMTIKELKALIDSAIEEKLRVWPGQRRDRSVAEVLESMRKNIWTPPPGTKSTLEMLREDRDR
jgi:hypothetical protein